MANATETQAGGLDPDLSQNGYGLGHTVVMLHSDQEPVLVQLLNAVQSRRVKRTLVRYGPRASHQSQGKIEHANRVINGVCRAMWLSLENLPSDSILIVADSTRSMVLDEISSEKRRKNCVGTCFWESVHEPSIDIQDVWQFEATETCTTETLMQDGEQESIAAVDY